MPKKKYFLSQADISKLLKNYGGGYRYKQKRNLSQKECVTYMDTQGGMLTINQLWDKETDKPYVMVYISDSDGKIYRKDKWNWFDTIKELYFDWTLQNGNYDIEFKNLEGVTMAKKRQSRTQKLEEQVKQRDEWLKNQEEIIKRMRERGEDSFLNSPTFIQMKDRIDFLDNCNKLSEIARVNAEGRFNKFSESDRKLYEDNKAFLEHEGDSDYFIGITECHRELYEIHKYKDEVKSLEGKIKGYKEIISERDKEIERLQGVNAELKHKQPTTTALSPDSKLKDRLEDAERQLQETRNNYNSMNKIAEIETQRRYEVEDKVKELKNRIAELELQLSVAPTTENISDEELEGLTVKDVRKKTSEEIDGTIPEDYAVSWYEYYECMSRADLVKRLKYIETVSERRRRKINELKKDVNDKRFEQYSQEDSVTYNEALQRIAALESNLKMYQEFYENSEKRNDELQQKVTELASATLTPEESIKIIEDNIEQDKELKKATQKKKGRPVTIDERQRALIFELHKNGHSIREIAKQIGKSVGSVHRIINEQQ